MWIGVSINAPVCLRCQLRISRSVRPQTTRLVLTPLWNTRKQSTAAAIVTKPDQSVERPGKARRPSKKSKKPPRRSWNPPQVAKLGVSSLGKPAEVLVLKARDRHVPPIINDDLRRSEASEPRILEALQAENMPLSSESVNQSLHQIGEPYRNDSKVLSAKQRVGLEKKLMEGFTHDQLRGYCMGCDGPNLGDPTGSKALDSRTVDTATPIEEIIKANTGAKAGTKLGKRDLVGYIIKHKWAIASLENQQTKRNMPIVPQKLEYMLNCRHKSLEEYAADFNVAIDIPSDGEHINIRGELQHVHAAQSDVKSFLNSLETSRVRSVSAANDLKGLVTPDFLDQVARTYNVSVRWTTSNTRGTEKQEEWLSICFRKTQDPQDALNAERAILLRERESLPHTNGPAPLRKISMWLSKLRREVDLVSHQPPRASKGVQRRETWARWMIPRQPINMEYDATGPNVWDVCPDNLASPLSIRALSKGGSESTSQTAEKSSAARHRQLYVKFLGNEADTLVKLLGGVNNDFFSDMPIKKQEPVRSLIQRNKVKEEIFVQFGKILFPDRNKVAKEVFRSEPQTKTTQLLTLKKLAPTLLSLDLPGLPNFLRSLSPFDTAGRAGSSVQETNHERCYRLRYVPLTSKLPPGFEFPTIEIDLVRKGKPGSAVASHVSDAWAILDEQYHQLLTPLFTLDLNFVRRIKRQLRTQNDREPGEETSFSWFEQQIQTLGPDQFPPFLNPTLPKYSVRYVDFKDRVVLQAPENPDEFLEQHIVGSPKVEGNNALYEAGPQVTRTRLPAQIYKDAPRNIEYMLESSELVHSTTYRLKQLCLEHLILEGATAAENREMLRLAPQPLLDGNIRQSIVRVLVERAFRLAANMSDSRLLDHRQRAPPSAN